jgi:hypothetical protein
VPQFGGNDARATAWISAVTAVDLDDRRELLDSLEHYYDAVPRSAARVEDLGPLTLFVRNGDGSVSLLCAPVCGLVLSGERRGGGGCARPAAGVGPPGEFRMGR